jgi:hypothetical protein
VGCFRNASWGIQWLEVVRERSDLLIENPHAFLSDLL